MPYLRYLFAAAEFLALCLPLYSQEVPLTLKGNVVVVKRDKVVVISEDHTVVQSLPFSVTSPALDGLHFWTYPPGVVATDKGNLLEITVAPKGDMVISLKVITADWDNKKFVTKFGSLNFSVGIDPPVPIPPDPPKPPTPDPKPPNPQPVTSFRVLFVYESAKTLTVAQNSVIHAKIVRDYLTANTTPENGWSGWREFDQNANADKDASAIKALWAAVQPKLTALPCVAVEVNGRAEIIPMATTPADMVATFEKYKAGK